MVLYDECCSSNFKREQTVVEFVESGKGVCVCLCCVGLGLLPSETYIPVVFGDFICLVMPS